MTTTLPRFLTLTWGELQALPREEKAKVWREYAEWERVKASRYLDGDYAKHGSRQATEWGE